MRLGKTMLKLADADDLGKETRAAIRGALRPVLEDLHHRMRMGLISVEAVDPEHALYCFVQEMKGLPKMLDDLEAELAKKLPSAHRRAA